MTPQVRLMNTQSPAFADIKPVGEFLKACRDEGIKPIYRPFWDDLPYANPYLAITPDILHQLYQGVLKHLVAWVIKAYGAAEIDARCRRLPPNHNTRLFLKGISTLSKVTGQEHSDMARILLGLVVDLPLPSGLSSVRLVAAVRAILDFLYLAQYPVHSTETLDQLDDALKRFHNNKSIFVQLGIRNPEWRIPKLHWLGHFRDAIERLGTTDNFNTEYTERLHIDLTKNAFDSTNGKDVYTQMTLWVERREKVQRHGRFIDWRKAGCPPLETMNTFGVVEPPRVQLTKWPSATVPIEYVVERHGAVDFRHALREFIIKHCYPNSSQREVTQLNDPSFFIPMTKVPVYYKARFWESVSTEIFCNA